MALARILLGAAFTIAASYSLGRLCLRRIPDPRIMALPVGAAILSLLVFLLLLTGAAFATSFLALGVCALIPQLWRPSLPEPQCQARAGRPHQRLDPDRNLLSLRRPLPGTRAGARNPARRSPTPILSPRVTGISREVKTLQY